MKTKGTIFLLLSFVIIMNGCKEDKAPSQSGPAPSSLVALHDPILEVQFQEYVYGHNMKIASDGTNLYTVNGGTTTGRIKRFTMAGVFIDSVNFPLDFRSIMYNKSNQTLYVSTYLGSFYRIASYAGGTYELLLSNFLSSQSAGALSWDGTHIYEFTNGTLNKYRLSDSSLVQSLQGISGAGSAVAVDDTYFYTWDGAAQTVYVYALSGAFVRNMTLPSGTYSYSLSFVDGYLFVALDGNYATGTWYGYNIRRPTTGPGSHSGIGETSTTAGGITRGDTTE